MTDYQDEPAPSDKPDTTSMTGAQFQRHCGTDPAKWADACFAAMRAHAASGDVLDGPSRAAFLAQWFRDYGEAAVAHAQASHQKILAERLVPRQE